MYWIKERHNPQLGVYFVPMGKMQTKEAKKYENTLYGTNYMRSYKSESEYMAEIQRLRAAGSTVNG